MRLMWAEVGALDARHRAAIRAAVPAADLRLVEESAPVAWVPVAVNVRATEAIWSELRAGAREAFFRRLGGADFDSSLLKATVASAIRLFGLHPGKLLRWTPRGWAQVFRDHSRLRSIDVDEVTTRLVFENLPAALVASDAWMHSVAAALEAIYDVTRRPGTSKLVAADTELRRMELRFSWAPA
jgi:hypothetical protein